MKAMARGYLLGLLGLMVALATTGYFVAGRALTTGQGSTPAVSLPKSTLTILGGRRPVELKVVKVSALRQLSNQRFLNGSQGVLYTFLQPRDDAWNSQRSSRAVSLAFLDSQGSILKLMDVEPCSQDRIAQGRACPQYEPGVVYRKILEVPQGWFAQHGVEVGHSVSVNAPAFSN